MGETPRYWYGARRSHWTARMALTWEGWLVDGIWFVSFIAIGPYVSGREHPFVSLWIIFGLLTLFLGIRRWKGAPRGLDD